jgi:hypothetical protein
VSRLTKAQVVSLKELGEPGHFRVNWHHKLSNRDYNDLLKREFIITAWTWASTTRPDTSITDAGRRALTEAIEANA